MNVKIRKVLILLKSKKLYFFYDILGFHHSTVEAFAHLGCYVMKIYMVVGY
jgi:hypothetical protein